MKKLFYAVAILFVTGLTAASCTENETIDEK